MKTADQRLERAISALRGIAAGAIRCIACGLRELDVDAVTILQRGSLEVPLCRDCLKREMKGAVALTPVKQPAHVIIAREALRAIEDDKP